MLPSTRTLSLLFLLAGVFQVAQATSVAPAGATSNTAAAVPATNATNATPPSNPSNTPAVASTTNSAATAAAPMSTSAGQDSTTDQTLATTNEAAPAIVDDTAPAGQTVVTVPVNTGAGTAGATTGTNTAPGTSKVPNQAVLTNAVTPATPAGGTTSVDASPPVNASAPVDVTASAPVNASVPVSAAAGANGAAVSTDANGQPIAPHVLTGKPLWANYTAALELAKPYQASTIDDFSANATEYKGRFYVPFHGAPSRLVPEGIYRIRTLNEHGKWAMNWESQVISSKELGATNGCESSYMFAIQYHPNGINFQMANKDDGTLCVAPSTNSNDAHSTGKSGIDYLDMEATQKCATNIDPTEAKPTSGVQWWNFDQTQPENHFAFRIVNSNAADPTANLRCLEGNVFYDEDSLFRGTQLKACTNSLQQQWFFEPVVGCNVKATMNWNFDADWMQRDGQ